MAESNYIEAIAGYRDALRSALDIADDPFKAPELTVETSRSVMLATWGMQTEWAAMMRKGPIEKPAYELLIEIRTLLNEEATHGATTQLASEANRIKSLVEHFFARPDGYFEKPDAQH